MGIWDFINSATDKVKQNAPNPTPVTAACQSTYNFSRTAVTKVNSAVVGNVVPTLIQYVPDGEGRAKINRVATSFVKIAAFYGLHEGLKCIPGGVPVYNIASRSLRDEKTEDYKEEVKKLHARIDRLERESRGGKSIQADYKEEVKKLHARIDRLERESRGGKSIQADVKFERESSVGKNNQTDLKFGSQIAPCLNSNVHLEPEDAIRIFMMKEFVGRYMFDDLLVPGVQLGKKSRKEP